MSYFLKKTKNKKGNKTDGKIKVEINEEAIEKAKKLAGYNMIITSEINMTASEIYTFLISTPKDRNYNLTYLKAQVNIFV